jgi:hypothetical protein
MPIINFKVNNEGKIIYVSYDASITIRDFILDFTGKYTSLRSEDPNIYTFKAYGKILNSPRFIDKKLGDLIGDNIIVYFVRKMGLRYGGGILTVDVSKNITKEVEPGHSELSYRKGCNGLNIRSTCKNENCIAYNDTVYVQIGYVQNWNLFDHLEDSVLCPSCKELISPENYYFKDCYYTIDYIKNSKGKMERGSVRGDAGSDKFKKFDEEESGEAFFAKLVFTVTRR